MSQRRTMMGWYPRPRKRWNYLDILGKILVLDVVEAYEKWGLPGEFLRAHPTEVQLDGVSYYMDALVELALHEPVAHWRKGMPPAERALAHFEVTDRLRDALRWRGLHYRTAEEEDNQFSMPLLQYVVVAGNVPVAGRLYDFGQGWNDLLQPCSLRVFYIDELPFHRWSELDPTNPYLRVLAILPIMREGGDPEPVLRAAVRALLEWKGARWKVSLLLSAVSLRNEIVGLACRVIEEEKERKMLEDVNYTEEQARKDFAPWLNGFLRPVVERDYVEPAVRRAERRVERKFQAEQKKLRAEQQKWRSEKHRLLVACLLEALRANSIRLPEWQKTALRELPCESLPSITVARQAKNATDFARRAGLRRKPNGGGDHE